MNTKIERTIRNFALQNAIRYNGKANPGNVISKVLGEFSDIAKDKKEMPILIERVKGIVNEINGLNIEQQTKELEHHAPDLLEKKVEKKELKPLHDAMQGRVVMRFEPSPSGPLHIGHAYALMLNYAYCKEYAGKLILRIADTNPENIDPQAYELIPDDFKWLCPDVPHEIHVQSDRMETYYLYALRLIEQGHAYICTCSSESFAELKVQTEACPCRNLSIKENEHRWKKMFDPDGFKEGEAAVRLKTDIHHKNPAMRDFPILRINENPHARQGKKYRVWPLMNLAVAIDDHEMSMTHVLRGKDHYDNTQRQKYIFDYFKWKMPEYIHLGRINFAGLRLSTSETRRAIEKGEYTGWTDVRIPFLRALRRRGYQPEAFKKYALSVGATMVDKTVDAGEFFKSINAFNKDVIDAKAWRLFFIREPVEIKIENAPKQTIELDLHPQHKEGGRIFNTHDHFLVSPEDYEKISRLPDGALVRLMDCLNFAVKKESDKMQTRFVFDGTDYEKYKQGGKLIIHWLPAEKENAPTRVLMPDGTVVDGVGEKKIDELEAGAVIQLERFGFCQLEAREKGTAVFCYGHR